MPRRLSVAFALALLAGAPLAQAPLARAEALPPSQPSGPAIQVLPTPDFVVAVAQSDQFEVEAGRLASMRALDPRVRRLGATMARDHAGTAGAIAAAARRAGLPSKPPGLDIGQQQMLARLDATTGSAFDRLYVDQQVQAHRRLLQTASAYAREGDGGPVRRAAVRIQPLIHQHLERFERMQ